MKVAHLFNINNVGYPIVKFLREMGIEADLIVDENEYFHGHPFWEETEFTVNEQSTLESESVVNNIKLKIDWKQPKWIKYVEKGKYMKRYGTYSIKLIRMLRKYDIIQAYTMGPIWAQFTNKPFVAFSTGGDLDFLAFENTFKGILMRRAYKKAKKTVFFQPHQISSIEKLKLSNSIFIPFPIDIRKYSLESDQIDLKKEYDNNLILFSPTRHDWEVKGNHIMLKGFAKFVKENKNALLFCVGWGRDLEKSKTLIRELKITENVKFLPLMSKMMLIKYYKACDIVLDQFCGGGSLGIITLEAMACKKPVIVYISESHLEKCYVELPPVLNSNTEEDIYKNLIEMLNMKKRKEIGINSMEWVNKYHNWKDIANVYIKLYEAVLSK